MTLEPLKYPGDPYNDPDYDEVAILKGEIERLRADNERLRTQCGGNCRYWEGRWRDEKAEVERLSSVLVTNRDMADAEAICARILADEEPFSPIDWRHDIAQAIANGRRAALEPKP
jgi:hypothetical protein